MVIVEFPSFKAAEKFYNSPAYTAIRPLREGAATVNFVLVDGPVAVAGWRSALWSWWREAPVILRRRCRTILALGDPLRVRCAGALRA